ncbi:MAG: hypothetical protein ACYSX1_01010 [Planctomycetota bacterium]|jgi:hypothetical protein
MCKKLICLTIILSVACAATDAPATSLKGAFYFRADSDSSARVGPYPDVMVRLSDTDDKLIFRRNKGYLPVWYTESSGEEDLPVQITRTNCENTVNPYSRVAIIETNPARAIVHWRYARNCNSIGITAWVDEHFTVYPDGVCMRAVKDSASTTFAQWLAAAPDIYALRLLPTGIDSLPASWLDPPALSVTSGDYTDEGFNDQRRCYTLQCNVTCAPTVLNATLDTSGGKEIHNPVIVIKNWGDADAYITVDGQPFADSSIGYADDMYGDHLVIWLQIESTSSIDISIAPAGGSGQFVDRALPPDVGYDFYADVPPLPMGSPEPGPFGAYYTNLNFNNRFDDFWRVGEHADIVVQFDDNAHRFVFWRGTNYGPHWVSDTSETPHSNWYGTQFVERRASEWGGDGCCAEPMQDWDCRYAHARIISSNPARAIVQWRYASCDKNYDIVRDGGGDIWGDWDEEYFTIYPDAISVRKVTAYSSRTGGSDMESPHIEYHEAIPVTNPNTVPEDNIHWNALSATNYAGNKRDWVAQDVDGGAMTDLHQITNRPIMVVRMKGSTVPVSIVEGTSVEHDPVGQHDCRPFNAYDDWPAWPEDDRSSGGSLWDDDPETHCYRYFWQLYPSHCSILHLKWMDYEHQVNVKRTKLMLFGMFDADQAVNVNNLIPLARSWQYAPTLSITGPGFTDGSYDKTQRAYKILRTSPEPATLQFTLQGSASSPVINPCFVVENWWDDACAGLTIDGQPVAPGPDFRQGIEETADGITSLVIWMRKDSTSPIDVSVLPIDAVGPAHNPSPPDGANDVSPNVLITWSPGQNAASHDVYFGTDFNDVDNASSSTHPNVDYENVDVNSFQPGPLQSSTAYYWRIDEVNDDTTTKGQTWHFTVGGFMVVDDMESYDNDTDISNTWEASPYPDSNNGASVFLEQNIAHGGQQSMKFIFETGSATYFTATRTYYSPQNWTANGTNHLSLWFYGYQHNLPDDHIYITLKDATGHSATKPYDRDPNNIALEEWQEWNVFLQDFNDAGVNPQDIQQVVIGAESLYWAGILYFDDIRLYLPRCIPDFQPAGDITGDCFVDFRDVAVLAGQWLDSPGSPSADIAPDPLDEFVDMLDLGALVDDWLQGHPAQ